MSPCHDSKQVRRCEFTVDELRRIYIALGRARQHYNEHHMKATAEDCRTLASKCYDIAENGRYISS